MSSLGPCATGLFRSGGTASRPMTFDMLTLLREKVAVNILLFPVLQGRKARLRPLYAEEASLLGARISGRRLVCRRVFHT